MLSKVSINRLLEAADILSTYKLPKGVKFDMTVFYKEPPSSKAPECGTAACACGIVASQPKIRKRGFTLVHSHYTKDDNGKRYSRLFTPKYKNKKGFHAVELYFGINDEQANDLFGAHNCDDTPKQVAKRIRQFVKQELKQQSKQAA